MECNRDEALRSKVLAEAKFSQRDYTGARKFAHKAKQLYPELEGLSQFIYVLDVHIVAQDKLQSGENNWYGILEVDSSADDNAIRKQYRRLALLLHPDKNKAVGAEAAFKHISEAWTVLSDKNKKAAYDARCQAKMPAPGVRPTQQNSAVNSVAKPTMSAFSSSFQRPVQAEQAQPTPPRPQPPTPKPRPLPAFAPPIPNSVTFWTSCPSCKMLLEYQRLYLLKNLCCPLCYKPFLATEVTAVSGTLLWPPPLPKQPGYRIDGFSNGFVPPPGADGGFPVPQFGSFPFRNMKEGHTTFPTPPSGNNAPQTDKVEGYVASRKLTPEIQQKVEERIMGIHAKINRYTTVAEMQKTKAMESKPKVKKLTKEELKAKAAADAKEFSNSLMAKLKGVIEQKLSAEKERKGKANIPAPVIVTKHKASPQQIAPSSGLNGHTEHPEGSQAKKVSVDKTEGIASQSSTAVESSKSPRGKRAATILGNNKDNGSPSSKKVKGDKQSVSNGNVASAQEKDFSMRPEIMDSKACPQSPPRSSPSLKEGTESMMQAATAGSHAAPGVNNYITVSDGEFFDFDKDRTESHFLPGQIWAAYDDDDGMPRYYARVNKVVSTQPFKIQISWLETRSTSDETLAWLDSGFTLTCGEFRIGKAITSSAVNMYSHMMKFEKGQRGGFKIYPQQGEVWALYKDWENLKAKDGKTGYLVVEVLADFKEEEGVHICKLAKCDGYKTLFQRQTSKEGSECIRTSDLRRFSHQIPAYRVTYDKVQAMKEDCWELDPASTPPELIS